MPVDDIDVKDGNGILRNVRALPGDLATGDKQDTGNALLTLIEDKLSATPPTATGQQDILAQETALNAVLGTIAGGAIITDINGTIQAYSRGSIVLLAALLAKLIAAPATEAKQDTGNTSLASMDTKLTTLHTDLATTLAGYVDGLETLVGTSNTNLSTLHTDLATTLAGLITSLNGYVDGLEALVTSSNSKLDTIHTDLGTTLVGLITSLNGYVDQLEGYTDGLEGKLDTVNTNLGTLHTDLATTLAGYVDGLETLVTSTNTALGSVLTTSDFDSKTGSLTETAPATDTASSGLNGRLQRIAQRLTSLIALLPSALGTGGGLKVDGSGTALPVSAASLPLPSGAATETTLGGVLTTSDFDSKAGSLTETAPATDTASSGLNGRLQRIAQRVTSMIALLPAALGSGGGLKVDGSGTALPISVADGSDATQGVTTGAAVITDANGTVQQYLRGLIKQWIAGTLTFASQAYSAAVTLTRTADTNAYAANDVLGAATGSTAALTFASMGPSGKEIIITSVALEIDASAVISGETSYRLYLYNVTPPSALGDNAAWDLPSGDRTSYLGYVDLGTPVDLGSTLYVEASGINKQVKLSGTSLFGYLVTNGGYTPTSARVYVVTLHAVAP